MSFSVQPNEIVSHNKHNEGCYGQDIPFYTNLSSNSSLINTELIICVSMTSLHTCDTTICRSTDQSMRNLVCRRSMSGKTCLRLVEILGLPVTMTGNFCKILLVKLSHDR